MTRDIHEYESKLMQLRTELDRLDRDIVLCLVKRFELTEKVGAIKYDFEMPIFDQSREAALLEKIAMTVNSALEGSNAYQIEQIKGAILKIYDMVLDQSKALQTEKHLEVER